MQEVFKNGTEGEIHVENNIEELIPHIKKSLENPNVKYVKVFRGKTISCITSKEEKKFTAEEEKKSTVEQILDKD